MQRESAFIAALESGRRRVSRHLVLVLLDERSAIVAQFARSDWD
jgi:hypothetical protein